MNKAMVLLGLLIQVSLTGAQEEAPSRLGFDLTTQTLFSSNIFHNASKIQDFVTALGAEFSYAGNHLNLFTGVSATLFVDNPAFNSLEFQGGLEWIQPLKNRNLVYLSLSYSRLDHRELYTDFNYSGPQLTAHLKLYLSPILLLKGGYSFDYRRYENFPSFDFFNHTLFCEISRFFPSQTTLRLSAAINARTYPHIEAEPDPTDNTTDQRAGFGRSGFGQHAPSNQTSPASQSMSVPNISLLAGLAQGLGTRFGISGEIEYRINFRGLEDAETLISHAYTLYPYNDQYLWDGLRMSLTLKSILGHEWALEGSLSRLEKGYPGIFVMDEAGTVLLPLAERSDTRLEAALNLSKRFKKWQIGAGFTYHDNRSNDLFFTYEALSVHAGLGITF